MDSIKAYLENEFATARKNQMSVSASNTFTSGSENNNASLPDSDTSESESDTSLSDSSRSVTGEENLPPPNIISRAARLHGGMTFGRPWLCEECTEVGKCIYCNWSGHLSAPLPAHVKDSVAYLKWLDDRAEIKLKEVYSDDGARGHEVRVFVFLASYGFDGGAVVQRCASAATKEDALRQAADRLVRDLRPLIGYMVLGD